MVKRKFFADANEDKIELGAYGAANKNLCRESEVVRTIYAMEKTVGRINWGIRHGSWGSRINALPANGTHEQSLRYAVSCLPGDGMMVTNDPKGPLCRVGQRVKHSNGIRTITGLRPSNDLPVNEYYNALTSMQKRMVCLGFFEHINLMSRLTAYHEPGNVGRAIVRWCRGGLGGTIPQWKRGPCDQVLAENTR